jgi:hypothetical protein
MEERLEFLLAQLGQRAETLDLGFLHRELGLDGFLGERIALLLDCIAAGGLGGGGVEEFELEFRDKAVAEQFLADLRLELGGLGVGLGAGRGSLGGEQLALELHPLVGQLGLGGTELRLGVG